MESPFALVASEPLAESSTAQPVPDYGDSYPVMYERAKAYKSDAN